VGVAEVTLVVAAVAAFGGAGGVAAMVRVRAERRKLRSEAQAADVSATTAMVQAAMQLVEPLRRELADTRERQRALEADSAARTQEMVERIREQEAELAALRVRMVELEGTSAHLQQRLAEERHAAMLRIGQLEAERAADVRAWQVYLAATVARNAEEVAQYRSRIVELEARMADRPQEEGHR